MAIFNKKFAFTLSEIMITMTILGFIATFTLKTVGTSIQKSTRLSEFKVAYSRLDLALKNVLADDLNIAGCYACPTSGDISKYGLLISKACSAAKTSCASFEKDFIKALNVTKTCNNATDSSCLPPLLKPGTGCFTNLNRGKSFVLDNGMILITDVVDKDDEETPTSFTQFAVDVNGRKGPNKWGQDVFTLAVTASKISKDGDVENVEILPPSSCLLGSGNDGKTSAQLIEEMANFK